MCAGRFDVLFVRSQCGASSGGAAVPGEVLAVAHGRARDPELKYGVDVRSADRRADPAWSGDDTDTWGSGDMKRVVRTAE